MLFLAILVPTFTFIHTLDCVGIKQLTFFSQLHGYLSIEVLNDSLVHFEHSLTPAAFPIYTTQMIDLNAYSSQCGPSEFSQSPNQFETAKLLIVVSTDLKVLAYDKFANATLTEFTPLQNGLSWQRLDTEAIYGIASAFAQDSAFGSSNGNFLGKQYNPQQIPNKPHDHPRFGNVMHAFDKGLAAACQYPIMYAKTHATQYAFFYDNVYAQSWDMTGDDIFTVTAQGRVRWFLIHGTSLQDLRRRYMQLVGGTLVPPKEYLGFQHSLFGFKSFDEMIVNVKEVRNASIPQDGMVLDLHWFGGQSERWVDGDPRTSRFGELQWDEATFPNPQANVALLRLKYAVGLTLIEEPYIGLKTEMYQKLAASYALVQDWKFGPPTTIDYNTWWGAGGLIDWTAPFSTLWHDCKRCSLIKECVVNKIRCTGIKQTDFAVELSGHWIDLGEPELLNAWERFHGYIDDGVWITDEAGVHNIYQLLSSKSLFDGYARSNLTKRPFSLIRTGTSGIHRYGSVMWSGDISAYLPVLANHYGAQKHAIMGGIDFFGSDSGGFFRNGVLDRPELAANNVTIGVSFTRWLANSVFTDVPLRTHCSQTRCDGQGKCFEDLTMQTNPATANRYNIRTRYELFSFYYSLAHSAYSEYNPVFLPLFLAFESDKNCAEIGDQIMIGPSLLAAHVTEYYITERRVYLPAGTWIDYRTHEVIVSRGQHFTRPAHHILDDGTRAFVVPLLVHGGAIVPRVFVDDYTLNNYGIRKDGSVFSTQLVRVWPVADAKTSFTIYDDDGRSTAYISGARQSTLVTLDCNGLIRCQVVFWPTAGSFDGAQLSRNYAVEFIIPIRDHVRVSMSVDGVSTQVKERASADYLHPTISYSRINAVFSDVVDATVSKNFAIDF